MRTSSEELLGRHRRQSAEVGQLTAIDSYAAPVP